MRRPASLPVGVVVRGAGGLGGPQMRELLAVGDDGRLDGVEGLRVDEGMVEPEGGEPKEVVRVQAPASRGYGIESAQPFDQRFELAQGGLERPVEFLGWRALLARGFQQLGGTAQ